MTLTEEIKSLFRQCRTALGAPIRPVQLEDEQLCDLLEMCVGDYASYVQNWVIESQWLNMMGNNTLIDNPADLAFALSTRTLDWSRDWSEWFSKEVGLQQRGTKWELKKDFFTIEKGKQVYVIPAGREINRVLYITPSTTKAALYGNVGMLDTGIGGGWGQYGTFQNGMGLIGFYVGSAYDTALLAADLKYKNSLLRGDLAYKVTAGPNGTHLVHLMSVPGSKNMLGGLSADDAYGWGRYVNCICWYTYYDVSTGEDGNTAEQCMLDNKDTLLITPDQVPLSKMHYELLNYPTQQIVRRLLIAEAKILLGNIRGYASGVVKIPEAEMQLDYQMLIDQGKQEKDTVLNELKERLDRMLPWNQMKNQADMNESLMNVLKMKAMPYSGIIVR
jgi:hypothetical protein